LVTTMAEQAESVIRAETGLGPLAFTGLG